MFFKEIKNKNDLMYYLIKVLDYSKILTILLMLENDYFLYNDMEYKNFDNKKDIIETFNNINDYLRKNNINTINDLLLIKNNENYINEKNKLIELLEN